jgi:hypothetical protein
MQQPRLIVPALGVTCRVLPPVIGFLVIAAVTCHRQFDFAWENCGIECPLFWPLDRPTEIEM